MSENEPSIIQHSVEKTNVWLSEIAAELRDDDRRYAYRALRAHTHVSDGEIGVGVLPVLPASLGALISS